MQMPNAEHWCFSPTLLLCLQLLSYTKKPSALCELFHFHNLPGGREPSGWQFKDASQRKTNLLAGFQAPVAYLGPPALGAPKSRSHV